MSDFNIVFRMGESSLLSFKGKKEDAFAFFYILNKNSSLDSKNYIDNIVKLTDTATYSISQDNTREYDILNLSEKGLIYYDMFKNHLFVCLEKRQYRQIEKENYEFFNNKKPMILSYFPLTALGMLACIENIIESSFCLNKKEIEYSKRSIVKKNIANKYFASNSSFLETDSSFLETDILNKKLTGLERYNDKQLLIKNTNTEVSKEIKKKKLL